MNKSANREGEFFGLWPAPLESDDSGMQLQVSASGVKELANEFYVLRFPLVRGARWKTGNGRVFQVLDEGKPCASGKLQFSRCLVIQDDDPRAGFRTITTYASSDGPVCYKYFRITDGHPQSKPLRTMTLVAYRLAQSGQSHK